MIGPVLHQEMLLGSRRNKLHILRWVYAGWLVVVVLFFYLQFFVVETQRNTVRALGGGTREVGRASAPQVVGRHFSEFFVSQQVILLLLVTPPFVAGAITDEKRRGTLQHLLLTDLESRHIVLGKLLGRLGLVGLIFLAGMPLFGLLAGFGGIDPLTLLVVAASLVAPTIGICSATLLASVWCRQTRDAVLALYLAGIVGSIVVLWIGGPLRCFNPLYAVEPAWSASTLRNMREIGWRLGLSALAWTLVSVPCLTLAILRLRPVFVREIENSSTRRIRWFSAEREPVDDEPVRWRERYVEGLSPNATFRRIPTWLGIGLISLTTIVSSLLILYLSFPTGTSPNDVLQAVVNLDFAHAQSRLPDAGEGFLIQSLLAMLLSSVIVGIRCSGAVTVERERQTWEALLLTPLSARSIIQGKLWGVMGASLWYLVAYAVPAVMLSSLGGVMALFYTVLGLAVTLLAMYFIGATGLYCSVTSRGSWRALLGTLTIGYLGGLVLYIVTSPLIMIFVLLIFLGLLLLDSALGTNIAGPTFRNVVMYWRVVAVCGYIGLALLCYLLSRLLLFRAYRYVADRERTRHWNYEPRMPRRYRREFDRPRLDRRP
jgi:ABC-type transport system involved in multi-copper enzyme maturation permease subunit